MNPAGILSALGRFAASLPKKAILKGVGLVLLSFLFALLTHLPLEPLAYMGAQSLMGRFPYRIEFSSLGPAFPLGIRIRELTLKGPTSVTLDTLLLRPALFVEGVKPGVRFTARRARGELKGVMSAGEPSRIRFTIKEFPLLTSGLGVLPNGLVITGELLGEADLLRTQGYPANLSGTVTLELHNTILRIGSLFPLGITELTCTAVKGDFTFASNLLKIEPLEFLCEKLHAVVRGEVTLRQSLPLSQLNLHFFLEPKEEFLALLQTVAPLLRLSRDPSGMYQGDFQGPLMHLIGRR